MFDIRIMPVGVEKTPRVPQYGMSKTTGAVMCAVVVSAILRRRAEADFDAVSTSIDLDFEGPTTHISFRLRMRH